MITLTQQARSAILGMIRSGEVPVGYKFSIRRLSRQTGFGFMPIQDAFKMLAAEGWVQIVNTPAQDRGTYVTRSQ